MKEPGEYVHSEIDFARNEYGLTVESALHKKFLRSFLTTLPKGIHSLNTI